MSDPEDQIGRSGSVAWHTSHCGEPTPRILVSSNAGQLHEWLAGAQCHAIVRPSQDVFRQNRQAALPRSSSDWAWALILPRDTSGAVTSLFPGSLL